MKKLTPEQRDELFDTITDNENVSYHDLWEYLDANTAEIETVENAWKCPYCDDWQPLPVPPEVSDVKRL